MGWDIQRPSLDSNRTCKDRTECHLPDALGRLIKRRSSRDVRDHHLTDVVAMGATMDTSRAVLAPLRRHVIAQGPICRAIVQDKSSWQPTKQSGSSVEAQQHTHGRLHSNTPWRPGHSKKECAMTSRFICEGQICEASRDFGGANTVRRLKLLDGPAGIIQVCHLARLGEILRLASWYA